jgi:alpha-mannosidase
MRKIKILLILSFIFVLAFSSLTYSLNQKEIQNRIQTIASSIENEISPWKLKRTDIEKGESPSLDDSNWELLATERALQAKIFWLRREFKMPQVYAGSKTEGSKVNIVCIFQGVGKYAGQFLRKGELKESFELDFGNQASEIRKEFPLTAKALPGEKINLALRFDNLGKLPLVKRETAESGTYFEILEARFEIESAQEAQSLLSQFLLDLKAAVFLLDLAPKKELLPRQTRPVSKEYEQFAASQDSQELRERFEKALLNFDLEALRQGNFARVKDSISEFYRKAEPISRLARSCALSLAGNSHIDLSWLWRWRETVEVAKQTFSTVMDNMEEYPEMVYVQSQAQVYKWMEEYYPDVFERIKKKVKEGRWEIVGGMWAEPDCNLPDGESFIRQLLYGKRYFKEKFGVDVKIGWVPDSFGYNWNLPQFFRKSGIDSFITQKISWNDTNVFPYFLFWWEGPDGSRVLTYFPPTGYVGDLKAEEMLEGLKNFESNSGLKNVLILYGLGDHGGGPNREMLNRARSYQKQKIFPLLKHSTVAEYLSSIRKKIPRNLPVWKDELYLEFHRGTYTTQAETKRNNRKSEVLLSNAEKANSLALLFGADYNTQSLKKAWEKVLLNQFHDILPGSSITSVYRDTKESYLEVQRLSNQIVANSLDQIGQKTDTAKGPDGNPLLIFNTLSWERDGIVKVPLPPKFQERVKVIDESGREVPSQVLASDQGNVISFIAKKVPALGYKIYKLQKGGEAKYTTSLKVGDSTLENQYFLITLNPESGNIVSIFDKLQKKEVLAPQAQGNQLQLFEDIPDIYDAWEIKYTGREWKLDKADSVRVIHTGPVLASIKVEKSFLGLSKDRMAPTHDFPSSFFTQEIILYDGIPRIDVDLKADWWENHVLLKVAFPVDVKNEKATYEIPYAFIERPTTHNTDWERARYEVPAIRWTDLSDGGYGVSLINECKYGYDIKDNVMRLTLLRSPLSPDPTADRGKHQFSYCLYPHKESWREAKTVAKAYEFNVPLLTQFLKSHEGVLPPSCSFFKVSPQNLILSTVKKAEDRNSLILRIYESEGKVTETAIELFQGPKKAYELDFMENRLRAVPLKEKTLTLNFGKSEIKTIELVY